MLEYCPEKKLIFCFKDFSSSSTTAGDHVQSEGISCIMALRLSSRISTTDLHRYDNYEKSSAHTHCFFPRFSAHFLRLRFCTSMLR